MTQRWLSRETVREFGRFFAVGVVATTAHYALMIWLVEVHDVGAVTAAVCGFLLGAVVSYTLNRLVTFKTRPAYGKGLAKFLVVVAIGAALNAAIVAACVAGGMHYIAGQVVATLTVMFWNFAAARLFVFR